MSVEAIYRGGGTFPSLALSGNAITYSENDVFYFPEPTTSIKCNFKHSTGALPTTYKDDERVGLIELTVNGITDSIPARLYIQGRTSANSRVPEKNWNMKFYKTMDDALNEGDRAWIKIGKRNASDKLIFKSWWIEVTKATPYMSFTLWDQMTNARHKFPKYEVDNVIFDSDELPHNLFTGATGSCSVWATVFCNNGEFYGIGDIITTKDYFNYNLEKNPSNPNHLMWRGGMGTVKNLGMDDSHSFEAQVPKLKNWDEEGMAKVNRLNEFVMGDDVTFADNLDDYFDRENLIDSLLFQQITVDTNGALESMYLTYDGLKWYAMPWDKDSTFGAWWVTTNDEVISGHPADTTLFTEVDHTKGRYMLHNKANRTLKPLLKARYEELKELGIFQVENFLDMMKYHESLYGSELRLLDMEKWKDTSGGYQSNFQSGSVKHLHDWVTLRIETLDAFYEL